MTENPDPFPPMGHFGVEDQFGSSGNIPHAPDLDLPPAPSLNDEYPHVNTGWDPLAFSNHSSSIPTDGSTTYQSFETAPSQKQPHVIVHQEPAPIRDSDPTQAWMQSAAAAGINLKVLADTIYTQLGHDTPQNNVAYGKYYANQATPLFTPNDSTMLQSFTANAKNSRRSSIASTQNPLYNISNESTIPPSSADKGLRCKYCTKQLPRLSALKYDLTLLV